MKSQSAIVVNANDFDNAVRRIPKMKRGPVGSRSQIPVDTLLCPDGNGVLVETPSVSSLVVGSGGWSVTASVEARKLVALFDSLNKIRPAKSRDDDLIIGVDNNQFWIKYKTTKLSLQLLKPLA